MPIWKCIDCGHIVVSSAYPHLPMWNDGHTCRFKTTTIREMD